MSKNGSEKEFILTLFLLKYPEYLEDLIGQKLELAEAEVPIGRRKVDLYAINVSRRLPIFIESQVNQSDQRHLEKVLEILDGTSEGTIIWIASGFNEGYLQRVRSYMKSHKHKYIDFYALRLHEQAILWASDLNKLHKLEVWGKLHCIRDSTYPPLELYDSYSQVPSTHTGRIIVKTKYDFKRTEDVKQYMLEKLRGYVPHLTNVWKAKKHNSHDCQLSLGGGRNGVNFKLSAHNKYGQASIYLHFDQSQAELYHSYESKIQELQANIHPVLVAKDRKIGLGFHPQDELDDTIRRLANILERMLKVMGPELYWGK
ncbi:hypothetical protein [Paenibacillus urinalis]|uniref:DUF4268 domain-containing protein n=1 Tax=Paenibacillus urinalis TaxID=521520 RepID=A0AAX3N0J0_9BACL|nr:hypothetical protein [Paenibacillus urinalis]WDH83358.1 hypothetical protein PUW23_03685 [Paenibacillus urinalis]